MAHILASHNDASGFASRLDRMPHIAELIVYQDPRPQRPPIKDCREDNIEDMSWVAGSYACLAASPQDVRSSIWTRILFFAMGKDGKHSIIRTCERFPGSMPNEGQWQFLLICKQLYELALPLLYHSPVITGLVGLQSLSRKLSTQLSLGSEIRLLMLYRGIASRSEILGQPELDDDYLSEVHQLVKNILTKAPNLQQLLTYERAFYIYSCPPFIMDWAALKTLCNIAGSSLHTLHGFQMKDEGQKSLSLFHDMIAIRSLEWYSRTVFHEDDGVLPTCLSSLEVLTLGLYDDSLLSALTKVNLPRLRSAVFQQVSNKNTSRSLRDFLEKHGSKLQHLEMVVPGLKIRSLFKWCPNLIRLVIKTNCLRPDFSAGALISLIHGGGSSKLRAMIIQDENVSTVASDALLIATSCHQGQAHRK
ncbi:hypothetical protein GLOTRDRAFT_141425 [Gloeophyllum trabeum ATCC 11539]|uniref:F-box domain-containing protein n=1 Tax=Gloeophyllum trabeum (strain ATCC 11539 / FP-39264 / Madison 617) TaxID=670483 RepID=S7PTI4_GLOTA|nr:uncharacterized protein GLOTRDRAFT_141425 [Gloeophyllum trabeum ATCC 11539]EPQ50627.1 hypothetical protein GLOTRDRAFT_141425 [Gloeophyllum trabeum ATCC 11539]